MRNHRNRLLSLTLLIAFLTACAESEDSTDDLLLGFLAGGGTGANPSFHFNKGTTDQAGAGSGVGTDVTFSNPVFNVANQFNVDQDTFAPTSSGKWFIQASVGLTSIEDGRYCQAYLVKWNGSSYGAFLSGNTVYPAASSTLDCVSTVSAVIDVTAGDLYKVRVVHNYAGTASISGQVDFTFVSGYRISD